MTSLRYFGAMLLTFAIVACGGGSYSISVSDVEGAGNTTGTNGAGSGALVASSVNIVSKPSAATSGGTSGSVINYSTSKFIDSAVAGLYYSSAPSSTVGTTAPDGSFKYVAGDTVTFKIGGVDGLDIGSSSPADGIPVVVTDLPGGEQVAQILQTFSTSANPSEKLDLSLIKFRADDVKALKKHIDDRGDLEVFKVGALATIAKSVSDSIGATLTPKSKSDVQAHLATSLANIIAAPRLSDQFYLLLTNYQDGNFNPAAFLGFSSSDKGFRIYDNGFNQISGTFIQGVDNVDMNLVNFQKINTEGNSYVDISSSANGCKASITEMTNWQSTDPASPTPQGFKANIKGPFSCAESSMNDTSGKTAILAAALDTSLKLADLSGKTLTTNLPKGNGTGCTNKVKFSFTPKSEFTLNVNAVVDPAESQTCKDSFNPDKATLTFGQASPSGGSYIDGLFAFGIEYKNSSKRAIIFLSRPKILANPATSNNPTANTFALLAYADNNTDKGNMQMKWANAGPVELTTSPAPSIAKTLQSLTITSVLQTIKEGASTVLSAVITYTDKTTQNITALVDWVITIVSGDAIGTVTKTSDSATLKVANSGFLDIIANYLGIASKVLRIQVSCDAGSPSINPFSSCAPGAAGSSSAPRLSDQFYLLLTNYQDGNFNPAAFLGFSSSDKGFRIYDNGFNQISGTFIQGVDNVDMNLVNFQKINTEGNSYVDISSSANGCKASITEMTNWQSTDPASPTPQGFKANIKGPFSCAESSMNDTSGKTAILAAALDTSLKLADLSGKTLTTNLPKGNGTGCTNKVKFSFTPKSEFTLNVNAVVDPAESQTCKDSFNPDKATLTFGQASPSGGSYIDGLFAFGIEYKNSSKRAIIFLSRPKILANPATSNNPTANTFALLAYADNNTDKGNMQMKWANAGPVELTPTLATSSSAAVPIFSDQIYFVTQKAGNDIIPGSFIKFSSTGKLFNIYSTSFDKISGTFDQNSNNLELNISRFQLSHNKYTDAPYSVAGCKILATAITGSIDSEAGGSWGIRGFMGTGSSISYCTDQRVNDTGLSQQLVAIELDTSPILADFKGKTLETKVPSGTGCDKDKTVKFAISNSSTAGNSKKLDVTAVVDPGETPLCKATFDVPFGKLTFSQANPEGQDVPGLFTLNIEYSSGKYVTMFLMRPYFSTVPSNNFSANMISFLAYADNIGPDGTTPTPYDLKIKSINGGPAKLTAP